MISYSLRCIFLFTFKDAQDDKDCLDRSFSSTQLSFYFTAVTVIQCEVQLHGTCLDLSAVWYSTRSYHPHLILFFGKTRLFTIKADVLFMPFICLWQILLLNQTLTLSRTQWIHIFWRICEKQKTIMNTSSLQMIFFYKSCWLEMLDSVFI